MKRYLRLALLGAVLVLLASASLAIYYGTHTSVDQAEDRRRWLQKIDADNVKAGFAKDTNGYWLYVGAANSHSPSN